MAWQPSTAWKNVLQRVRGMNMSRRKLQQERNMLAVELRVAQQETTKLQAEVNTRSDELEQLESYVSVVEGMHDDAAATIRKLNKRYVDAIEEIRGLSFDLQASHKVIRLYADRKKAARQSAWHYAIQRREQALRFHQNRFYAAV